MSSKNGNTTMGGGARRGGQSRTVLVLTSSRQIAVNDFVYNYICIICIYIYIYVLFTREFFG